MRKGAGGVGSRSLGPVSASVNCTLCRCVCCLPSLTVHRMRGITCLYLFPGCGRGVVFFWFRPRGVGLGVKDRCAIFFQMPPTALSCGVVLPAHCQLVLPRPADFVYIDAGGVVDRLIVCGHRLLEWWRSVSVPVFSP